MKRTKLLFSLLSCLLAVATPFSVEGQASTSITGRVSDQTGAVIPKATVTAHNEATDQDITAVTTGTGDFTFPILRPGIYDVSANAPGFDTATETGVNLHLDGVATVKLTLKPGAASTSVVVHADEVQLDLTHADRGVTFTQDELEQSPFSSGNPLQLANTEPGVVFYGTNNGVNQWIRPFDNGSINQFSTNGQGSDSNDFQIDGSPDNSNSFGSRDIGYVPPTASIQEMKFISNPYDAQYGHTGGGIFDIVTKYGGNTLHGQVYENARRTWLDANTHYDDNPIIGLGKESDNRDQYGFEVDGPVVIPHFYNGHDKTFFELQFERYSQNTPQAGIDNVPALSPGSTTQTAAQTGDFSADYYWNGASQTNDPVTIYDPLTENTTGGCDCRNPFPNNQIPTNRLNSEAILGYLPLPNRTSPVGEDWGIDDYVWQKLSTDRFDNAVARLDRNFGDKNRTYIRFAWNKRFQNNGDFNGIPGLAGTGVFPLVRQNHFFTTDWQHTFSANSLFDLHMSFTRYAYNQNQGYLFDLSNIGLGSLSSQVTAAVFPQINMNTYTVFGDNASNGGNKLTITNTIAAMPMWTYIHGRHTMKAGVDYRLQRASSYVGGASSGTFYVDSEWTQQYSWGWTGPQGGDSVGSFVLGTMDNGSIFTAAKQYFTYPYYAPFFQDDWKVTPKLTVNFGLRWDLQEPPTESANKIVGGFNTTTPNPVASQVTGLPSGITLVGGNTYAGVDGQPRTLFNWDWLALQPRVGFAWALYNNKAVVRGGIGSTYEQISGQGYSQGFSQSTSYDASNSNGLFPNGNTIDNPFPTIAKPAGASLGLLNSLGDSIGVSNRGFHLPGVVNYSLGVENQLTPHTTFDLSFVGSTGFRLDSSDNINRISTAFATSCNLELGATVATYKNCIQAPGAATASNPKWVANPFQGVTAFSTAATGNGNGYYTNPVLSASTYTRAFPEFGDITQTEQNAGKTAYDSLQAVVSHHWSNALIFHSSFVWSKTMDSGWWNDSVYRIKQHFLDTGTRKWRYTANTDWHIPVGKGRTLLGNSNRLVDSALGGWVMGAIYYYEAGTPAGVPSSLQVIHHQNYGVHRTFETGTHLIRAATTCVGWYDPDPQDNATTSPSYNNKPFTLGDVEGQTYTGCTATATGHDYDFIVTPSYGANYNVSDPGVYNPRGQNLDLSMSKTFPRLGEDEARDPL